MWNERLMEARLVSHVIAAATEAATTNLLYPMGDTLSPGRLL